MKIIGNFCKFTSYIIALSVFSAFSQPALAEKRPGFDLAGIHIGDTPAEVDQVAAGKGYPVGAKKVRRGPSFAELIASRRSGESALSAKGAIKQVEYNKGPETLTVQYLPWKDGPRVSQVIYSKKIPTDDCDEMKAAYNKRYGHGYEYAGEWLDRAPIKKRIGESVQPGTIRVLFNCSYMTSRGKIMLSEWGSREAFNKALDAADGEPTFDF